MRPLVLKILFAVAACATGASGAWGIHHPTAGAWIGKSYSDTSGGIAGCVMAARYDNDHILLLLLSKDGSWHLGLGNSTWRLAKDQLVRMTVEVDGTLLFADDSFPVSELVLSLHIPVSQAHLSDLQGGSVMTLGMWETTVSFGLDNIDAVLHALQQCVETGVAAAP
jgi:hypothetical protein